MRPFLNVAGLVFDGHTPFATAIAGKIELVDRIQSLGSFLVEHAGHLIECLFARSRGGGRHLFSPVKRPVLADQPTMPQSKRRIESLSTQNAYVRLTFSWIVMKRTGQILD